VSPERQIVLPPRSILTVVDEVLDQVRKDERMSAALDAYAEGHENVHIRWLSRLGGYEVTLRFDAATFDADPPS
jgi:hypothetical protein